VTGCSSLVLRSVISNDPDRKGADAPMPRRLKAFLLKVDAVYTVSLSDLPNATCAAARRAMGTRYGEQLT
jgi:hypothetical protein